MNPGADAEKSICSKKDLIARREYLDDSIKNIEDEIEKAKLEEEWLEKLKEETQKQMDCSFQNKMDSLIE